MHYSTLKVCTFNGEEVYVAHYVVKELSKYPMPLGGSPGLVVIGGDPCSKGCEFESRHHILNGHFLL